jgi:hypothetical protein
LHSFLLAQQAAWLKKAMVSTNDNWKYDMRLSTNNFNILDRPENQNYINNIFTEAGYKLQQKLALIGNNFLKVPIINNPLFGTGRNLFNKLDDNFFETKLKITGTGKWDLTWANLVDEMVNLKCKPALEYLFRHSITDEMYDFLCTAFAIAKKKYFSESLKNFFDRNKTKGIAKKIRLFLDSNSSAEKIKKKVVENFAATMGITEINTVFKKKMC